LPPEYAIEDVKVVMAILESGEKKEKQPNIFCMPVKSFKQNQKISKTLYNRNCCRFMKLSNFNRGCLSGVKKEIRIPDKKAKESKTFWISFPKTI